MHPILFKIGSFEFASYGLMTALGYAAAAWYLYRRLDRVKIDKDTFWNILFIAFVGALAGGKLLYILVSWPELGATTAERLANVIRDLRYGFVFYGGAIVGIGSLAYYLKRKKLPLLSTADFLIVALPLGHAIGRIGCFLAGCCHGKPTDSVLGVAFTNPNSLVARDLLGVPVHPTQLYEAAANLLLFALLHYAYKRPHKNGAVLVLYLVGYSLIRFTIEFFRGDFRGEYVWGLSPSQWIALFGAVAGLIVLRFLKKEPSHG